MKDSTYRFDHPSLTLGIDVGKQSLEVALLTVEDKLYSTSVDNSAAGFSTLVKWLSRQADDLSAVHSCLEASGGYEEPVATFLHDKGLHVSVVNPRRTKAYADVALRRSKTDSIDAALLARFCMREMPDQWQPQPLDERKLRQLTRGLQALKDERSRIRTQRQRAEHEAVVQSLDRLLETLDEQIEVLSGEIESHMDHHPAYSADLGH